MTTIPYDKYMLADEIQERFGIATAPAKALAEHFDFVGQIEMASTKELRGLDGVGRTTINQIRAVQEELEERRRRKTKPAAAQLPPLPETLPLALVRTGSVVHIRGSSEDARNLARFDSAVALTACEVVGLLVKPSLAEILPDDEACPVCQAEAGPEAAQLLTAVSELAEFVKSAEDSARELPTDYESAAARLFG